MKITTKDFQILKGEHTFEFPIGVTVIQGKTGSGKTTIFYAVEDCLLNPSGVADVINWNAKTASVTIENNNNKITWIKTQTSSEYKNELTGEYFVKASKKNSTDLGDLGFYINDDDVVNIQSQWKKLFPFGLKDTEMFKMFEDIFNISCSFKILDDYKKDEQQVKSQIKQTNEEINKLTQVKNNIQDILSNIDVKKLDDLKSNLTKLQVSVEQIRQDYDNLLTHKKYKHLVVPQSYNTDTLIIKDSYYIQLKNDYDNYLNLKKLQKINLPELQKFNLQENIYKEDYNLYKRLKNDINNYIEQIKLLDQQKLDIKQKLKDIKICPTCGQPINEEIL